MGQSLPDPGTTLEAGDAAWRATPAGVELLRRLGPIHFDAAEGIAGFELLKRKPDRFWGRLRTPLGEYFIKARRIDRLRRRLKTFLQPSAMREEWRKAWWLISKGIATPEPLCVGEVRRHGMLRESFFISSWIENARPLRSFLDDSASQLSPGRFERLRRPVAEGLGRLLGTLHSAGAYHWEFHDMNVLVAGDAGATLNSGDGHNGAALRFQPIDLDHLIIPDVFSEDDRAWNFHQLPWYLRKPLARWGLSSRDLVSFVRSYHAAAPDSASDWKSLFRMLSTSHSGEPPATRPHRRKFKRV